MARMGGVQCGNTERGRPQSRLSTVNKGKSVGSIKGGRKKGGQEKRRGGLQKRVEQGRSAKKCNERDTATAKTTKRDKGACHGVALLDRFL